MAATSETQSSAHSDAGLFEKVSESTNSAEEAHKNENEEESYPPTSEAILIMFALATAIFLVSLVSFPCPTSISHS